MTIFRHIAAISGQKYNQGLFFSPIQTMCRIRENRKVLIGFRLGTDAGALGDAVRAAWYPL